MKRFFTLSLTLFALFGSSQTMTFENINLPIDTFWNGSDLSGFYKESLGLGSTDSFVALNQYDTSSGGYWSGGIAISTMTDDTTAGLTNLYGSIAGAGYNSTSYGVVNTSGSSIISVESSNLVSPKNFKSAYVCNSTFAYLSMVTGDIFAKVFGGADGTDPDYFLIRFSIYQKGVLAELDFYLADFRSSDSTEDYIIDDWTFVDLSEFGGKSDSIHMQLLSSDTGTFGMNTPSFFCIDDLSLGQVTGVEDTRLEDIGIDLKVNLESILVRSDKKSLFQLLDINGKILHSTQLTKETRFNTTSYPKGIYIIRSLNDDGEQATKVWRW